MIRIVLLCLVSVLFAIGCARTPGGIAASNIPLEQGGYTVLGPVKASDCKYNLFGIIPISGGNHSADALAEALGDRPGAEAMVNITVEGVNKFFILWSQQCADVRGLAVSINPK